MPTFLAHKFANVKIVKIMGKITGSEMIKYREVGLRLTRRFRTGEHLRSMNKQLVRRMWLTNGRRSFLFVNGRNQMRMKLKQRYNRS
jgi:hypothetical protein